MTNEEAIKILRHWGKSTPFIDREKAMKMAIEALSHPEQRTGHWIKQQDGILIKRRPHSCSVCNNFLEFEGVNAGRGDANYCPACGAKMQIPIQPSIR